MNYKFWHNLKYINWTKEAQLEKVSCDEFVSIKEKLESAGGVRIRKKTLREAFFDNDYYLEKTGNWVRLYYKNNKDKYIIVSTNSYDEAKNGREKSKSGALTIFTKKFREDTGLGHKALSTAFGTTGPEFKNCIPKQFYYMNKNYICSDKKTWSLMLSGIDDSSHYPSCALGRMPDANTMIEVDGIVEPSDEYPFAFWLESGHCAEKGRFDTRDWMEDQFWWPYLFGDKKRMEKACIKDKKTVLMKASAYTMDETWKYFYSLRKEDEGAKLVMNSAIGQMHQRDCGFKKYSAHPYAHLAAVILARANTKHWKKCKDIGTKQIVSVVVDSIIYKSCYSFGCKPEDKDLGKYVQEFLVCKGAFKSTMCYIIKGNGYNKIRTSGYNAWSDGRPLDKDKIDINNVSPAIMWDWIKVRGIDNIKFSEEEIII